MVARRLLVCGRLVTVRVRSPSGRLHAAALRLPACGRPATTRSLIGVAVLDIVYVLGVLVLFGILGYFGKATEKL